MKHRHFFARYYPLFSFLIIVSLVATSCAKPYYINSDFKKTAKAHKSLAIAPTEMVLTGTMPEGLNEEDIQKLEETESVVFQKSLHSQILRNPKAGRKDVYVTLLSVDKTNEMLAEQGVNIRDSWKKTPDELATLLGVDAVVRARVEKTRYFSDMVSYGIDLGQKLLNLLTGFKSTLYVPKDIDKSGDIHARCGITNGSDGEVLWSMTLADHTDWNDPSAEVIDRINFKMAKNFPYRVK